MSWVVRNTGSGLRLISLMLLFTVPFALFALLGLDALRMPAPRLLILASLGLVVLMWWSKRAASIYLTLAAAGEVIQYLPGLGAFSTMLVVAALGLVLLARLRPDLVGLALNSPPLAGLPAELRTSPLRFAKTVAVAIILTVLFITGTLTRSIYQGAVALAEIVRLAVASPPLPAAPGYYLVFDAGQKPPTLWFPAAGLVFVLLGLLLWHFRHSRFIWGGPFFAGVYLIFAIGWTVIAGIGIISQYLEVQTTLKNGQAAVVEGYVQNFHPMPSSGHDTERFTVNGVQFAYSDYSMTSGFNNTSSHGGPIREGIYVRIHYTGPPSAATILRLEIKR